MPLDDSWDVWAASIPARQAATERKSKFLKLRRLVREFWRAKFRAAKLASQAIQVPPLINFINQHMDRTTWSHIPLLMEGVNQQTMKDRLGKDESKYPVFTAFVHNAIYLTYCDRYKHNISLDNNATADLEIMLHLLWGDILVTEETKFQKTAFNDLWQPRGKRLFNVEGFVNFIRSS